MLSQQLAQHARRTESRTPPAPDPTPSPAPRGALIDAAIDQLLKEQPREDDAHYSSKSREKSDLTRVLHVHAECDSGDTLVIVNFPSGYLSCSREEWTSKRFYVHSEKLLATGSKVFENLLSPKKQARFLKSLELTGEVIPAEYVIDLTPSIEGDDLAAQLIELSLPASVIDWWTSKERLGISQYLVSGHDDHCPHHDDVPVNCKKKDPDTERLPAPAQNLPIIDLSEIETPESRAIVDYCPIRHRVNIIRLILAIEGYDLVLNSAPRVYTLTGIARILDCTNVVRDSVYTWLLAEPNTDFTDINPEVAFKIAWTLEIDSITRAAFRILVVEKAFDSLATVPPENRNQYTVFGRPRVDLPDDLQTVVQYAAQKLADRIQQTLAKLRSDQFFEIFHFEEYRKFIEVGDAIRKAISNSDQPTSKAEHVRDECLNSLQNSFHALHKKLLEYKNDIMVMVLGVTPENERQTTYDRDRRCYVKQPTRTSIQSIASDLSVAQRLLTPWFWEKLAMFHDSTEGRYYPNRFFNLDAVYFNNGVTKAAPYLCIGDISNDFEERYHFNVYNFCTEFYNVLSKLWDSWIRPHLEVPLNRTEHMVLSLSDEEFQYLPLWADGLNDGSGGVFQSTVPDADLGPIGPGPAYCTGNTVATDTSSICQSDKTPSEISTATLTAGRSVNAVLSNIESTVRDGPSVTMSMTDGHVSFTPAVSAAASTATMDRDDSDGYESDDSDEIDEEAWSQVEEPLTQ
ncbi:hypothetical protein F5Y11DRAFT_311293 [Daldinia sp. FL1419]|nr:hypothetical protein F5Y11DRAFT_311293 [Daldinia sp. FL1419]